MVLVKLSFPGFPCGLHPGLLLPIPELPSALTAPRAVKRTDTASKEIRTTPQGWHGLGKHSTAPWEALRISLTLWPGLCVSAEVAGGSREVVMRKGVVALRAAQDGPSQHQAPPRKRTTQLQATQRQSGPPTGLSEERGDHPCTRRCPGSGCSNRNLPFDQRTPAHSMPPLGQ